MKCWKGRDEYFSYISGPWLTKIDGTSFWDAFFVSASTLNFVVCPRVSFGSVTSLQISTCWWIIPYFPKHIWVTYIHHPDWSPYCHDDMTIINIILTLSLFTTDMMSHAQYPWSSFEYIFDVLNRKTGHRNTWWRKPCCGNSKLSASVRPEQSAPMILMR